MSSLKHLWWIALVVVIFSCRKDTFITSPQAIVTTSSDSLYFDTVFVSRGSITQSFKIFNGNSQKLNLSSISLAGGASSAFKININGTPGPEVANITLDPHDSLYVFVQVNIDPRSGNLPFLVEDSIQIRYNGTGQQVRLSAYGQNAHYLNGDTLRGNTVWNDSLPYVILGGIQVDTGATLTLQPGTRVYLHANAPFLVAGTLIASGTRADSIVFNGDRLDPVYSGLPASWPGIYFGQTSQNNYLKHVLIENAYQGLIADGPAANGAAKLTLTQCILSNIYDAGVLGLNSSIHADNCLIYNCGSNINLALGGTYRFLFCTVASYSNYLMSHTTPVLQVSDAALNGNTLLTAPLNAFFQNCIFWGDDGSVPDEISVSRQGTASYSLVFDHVLYRQTNAPANAVFNSCLLNEDPRFDSIGVAANYYDFHFNHHPGSPALNSGAATNLPVDLDDQPRSNGVPDLGCYEKWP